MGEVEVDFVKIQRRGKGSFMVTIPIEIARTLKMKNGRKIKVFLDEEKKRIIYQL